MSNIHRLNQNRNDPENNNNNIRENFANDMQAEVRNIRKETFCQFIKGIFCRRLKLLSFTALMAILIWIVYIITLCWGIEDEQAYFLSPKRTGPVFDTLIKNNDKLRRGQIWRFITYSILHIDLAHITFNTITLLIFGSLMEDLIKACRMSILWFVSGILGILFSSLISESTTVGASVCVYGIIGAYVSIFS